MPSRAETINLIENDKKGAGTIGTSGFALTAAVIERGNSLYHATRIAFSGTMTLADNAGSGSQGSLTLYTFPLGAICVGGLVGSLTLAAPASNTGTVATAAAIISVGTAAAGADTSLTSTEANILQSTAATFVASTKTVTPVSTATPTIVDGTTTAKSVILNLVIPQAGNTGTGAITVSGFVDFPWENTGTLAG